MPMHISNSIIASISTTVFICKITLRHWAKKYQMRLNTAIDMFYILFFGECQVTWSGVNASAALGFRTSN